MKASANQIFTYIQGMNATTSTISSMGSFVSENNRQVAASVVVDVVNHLAKGSLAHKIATSTDRFTDKQLWVIAFELVNNEAYSEKVAEFYTRIERKANAKAAAAKAKLTANKEASADVLAPIKAAKRMGEFGKWLNTSGNPYRKENFNKKYTQESVNAFLNS